MEDYVHRVGRTGRAGSDGIAYSFFTKKNFMIAPGLIKVLQQSSDPGICPALLKLAELAKNTRDPTDRYRRWRQQCRPGGDQTEQNGEEKEV